MRGAEESLVRDVVRHLEGTNRAANTQTIYRPAALGLGLFLEQNRQLPAPRHARAALSVYPVPRSVWIIGSWPLSILRRR